MELKNIFKSNQAGFEVKCKNHDCIGGRIETTLEDDSGYSNWTVMGSGKIAFKCHGCGKYGSTYEYDMPNEIDNFSVVCLECREYNQKDGNWSHIIGDVDGQEQRTHIECKTCGQRLFS